MKNGRNYPLQGDPSHNPQFSRHWVDEPLGLPDLQRLIAFRQRVPLEIEPNENNLRYLRTKKEKLGHVLNLMG